MRIIENIIFNIPKDYFATIDTSQLSLKAHGKNVLTMRIFFYLFYRSRE